MSDKQNRILAYSVSSSNVPSQIYEFTQASQFCFSIALFEDSSSDLHLVASFQTHTHYMKYLMGSFTLVGSLANPSSTYPNAMKASSDGRFLILASFSAF